MQQKQFIESKLSDIDSFLKIGIEITPEKLKVFLSTALKEIVEEHFKEIMVKRITDFEDSVIPQRWDFTQEDIALESGFNQALDQITSRHNEFLS